MVTVVTAVTRPKVDRVFCCCGDNACSRFCLLKLNETHHLECAMFLFVSDTPVNLVFGTAVHVRARARPIISGRQLNRPNVARLCAIVACALIAFWSSAHAWTIASRELVDLQFAGDDSLIVLVTAPAAPEPGIYRWPLDATAPSQLCKISWPTSFSFDRKTIIERVSAASTEVQLYAPSTCALGPRVPVEGKALDVDVHGNHIAAVLRLANLSNELRLYTLTGRKLARVDIGRNIEVGFSPDGLSVMNFDFNDGGSSSGWAVPTLVPERLPSWFAHGETTFVPGSRFIKRYVEGAMSVSQWPNGKALHTATMPRVARLRQLSTTGQFGLLHVQDRSGEALDWIDFSSSKRVRIALGSIDNATINGDGTRVAWARRTNDAKQSVEIHVESVGHLEAAQRSR
jgi:hypothetical protein